jgi:hypothetical protein
MTREDVEARLTTLQTELERQMAVQRQLTGHRDGMTQE